MIGFSQSTVVSGGDGCEIAVYAAGPADGIPIVCLHGIGQTAYAFAPLAEVAGDRGWHVMAPDLRGHGVSGKPDTGYGESRLWAADVRAVLAAAGADDDRPATVVAWSYGGAVVSDYLTEYGSAGIRGLVSLAATTKLGKPVGEYVQPPFAAATKQLMTDDSGEIAEKLLDMCSAGPIEPEFRAALLRGALACPAYVRNGMLRRTLDNDAAIAAFGGPVRAVHGTADQMFTVALSEHIAGLAGDGRATVLDGVGHMPLWEAADEIVGQIAAVAG